MSRWWWSRVRSGPIAWLRQALRRGTPIGLALLLVLPHAEARGEPPLFPALGRLERILRVEVREQARLERRLRQLAKEAATLEEARARTAGELHRVLVARARLERRLERLRRTERMLATRLARMRARAERVLPVLLETLRREPRAGPAYRRAALLWRSLEAGLVRIRGELAALRSAIGAVENAHAEAGRRVGMLARARSVIARDVTRLYRQHTILTDAVDAHRRLRVALTNHRDTLLALRRKALATTPRMFAVKVTPITLPAARPPPDRIRSTSTLVALAPDLDGDRLEPLDLPDPRALEQADGPGLGLAPVAGVLLARFGEGRGGLRTRGVTYAVDRPRLVRAPRSGRVVFAGPFRDWGALLILDHGDGYHTLIAGMARLEAMPGTRVAAGRVVGMVRPAGGRVAHLYLELRFRGRPIDPLAGIAAKVSERHRG